MPYINVQFTKGATKEAKREIVKGVTDLMVEHLGKRPEHVHVVIQEVEFEVPHPVGIISIIGPCLLYTSPSPRDRTRSRMPSSA